MRLTDRNLRGTTVIGSDGQALGVVVSIFIDGTSWGVESLQLELHKDIADRIGAGRSMFHAGRVEIPTRLVQSVGDAVVLTVAVDGLRQSLSGEGDDAPAP